MKVLGHPVHVPLTHFPLALWSVGFLGDLVYLWRGDAFWWHFGFWNIAAGLAVGSLTLATGFYDYLYIPENKPLTLDAATWHMMVMLTAACLFGTALYFHQGDAPAGHAWQVIELSLSGLGFLCLQWGGWLGGQLVYHHGLGYDE